MDQTATILKRVGNIAIVQLPDRQFPGITVQGDTWHGDLDRLRRVACAGAQPCERAEGLASLIADWEEAMRVYAEVLAERGMRTPW